MSIFKDTLYQYVQDQLSAREIVISQGSYSGSPKSNNVTPYGSVPRNDTFMRYVSGKNSWVRMQSFVNTDPKNGLKIGNKTYYDDQLARKYILEGGTLFETESGYILREGVSKRESIYASDIDLGGTRPLGLRPMPGISSIQIVNKSAYGSLREATVKFYCWDKHQLEELEVLFMRVGYSVLLEWGWSQYIQSGIFSVDEKKNEIYNNVLDNISIQNFDYPTIDIFKDEQILNPTGSLTSDEIIYSKIETLIKKTNGNYDAMLGHVKNFSWQLLDNGGFECTTILISRGEIISTLKLSNNSTSIVFDDKVDPNVQTPPLSQFEKLFLNYTALVNDSELTAKWRSNNAPIGQFATSSNPITSGTATKLQNDLGKKLGPNPSKERVPLFTDDGKLFNQQMINDLNTSYGITLLTAGQEDGVGIEYIKMDHFVSLLNLYFNYKDKNNRVISQILIPSASLCLASTDSVSVDPTTCLIFNEKAEEIVALAPKGFTPNAFISVKSTNSKDLIPVPFLAPPQFLTGKGKYIRGKINNIYIAIPKILSIFRETAKNGDVDLIEFFKKLLNQISIALGGINDFSLHTTKSIAQIIDIKYLEQGRPKKYKFDLLGLKSICRDVKITSRIFESQASMIAIAAQSKTNIGDLYTSTQVYFNKGIRDRILPEKDIYIDSNNDNIEDFYLNIYRNIIAIANYLRIKVIGDTINIGGGTADRIGIIYPSSAEISNASSLLKTFHYQLRGDETSFKAIIPFELEITLDGLAGFVQGQIFKIDSSILPSMYDQRNLGFIITGISHSLQKNDWTTIIKTQVCLLDDDNLKINNPVDFNKLRSILQNLIQQGKKNQYLIFAIADYLTDITLKLGDPGYNNNGYYIKQIQYINEYNIDTRERPHIYAIVNGLIELLSKSSELKNFETYLQSWLNYYTTGLWAPLDTPEKRQAVNFPETIDDLKSFPDPSDPSRTISFDTKLVDALVFNKTDRDSFLTSEPVTNYYRDRVLLEELRNIVPWLVGYNYSYIGRGSNDGYNNFDPTIPLPPESTNSTLTSPLEEANAVIYFFYRIMIHQIINLDNNRTEFEKGIKVLKKYNLITIKQAYSRDGRGARIIAGDNITKNSLYNFFLDRLINYIFSNPPNQKCPPEYLANNFAIADQRRNVDNHSSNYYEIFIRDFAARTGIRDMTKYLQDL